MTFAALTFNALALVVVLSSGTQGDRIPLHEQYRDISARILGECLIDHASWGRLAKLSDYHPQRFSGTDELERAIDWVLDEMKHDGLENVRREECMIPRWVRGNESARMVLPAPQRFSMLGLGGSVGTPAGGIQADAIVVSSFEDLARRADEAKGCIVVYNVPFTTYGATVRYRSQGAIEAAKAGAIASLIRSVGPESWDTPHTGAMGYFPGVPKIPGAAISIEDAEMLQRMSDRGERIVLHVEMEAKTMEERASGNALAEIVGREKPDEIILFGGHIDSWDVGKGALDDGGGSVACWEALRVLNKLGLRPRRTLRVCLFTNEENGLAGAKGYATRHKSEFAKHVVALEVDSGIYEPSGFGISGPEGCLSIVSDIARLLNGIGASNATTGGGGADIGMLMAEGVPGMSLNVANETYFNWHHTEADSVHLIDPRDMSLCVASLAVMTFVLADAEERLPWGRKEGG